MWNWIEINSVKDLPDFNKQVLLYEKKDNKHYAIVGNLKSIDVNGYHWNINNNNPTFDMFNIFNELKNIDKFKPTHWCDIEIPKTKKE